MNNPEEVSKPINKLNLLKSFQEILSETEALGGWNSINASKLNWLNKRRHNNSGDMIDLGLSNVTSWVFGSSETDQEITIAQDTHPKRKRDALINERHYYDGVRHLKDEVSGYIDSLNELIQKEDK